MGESRTAASRLLWWDVSIIAAACVLLRLPALWWNRWYDVDEASIAVQARTIRTGGDLYVDMADRKPPVPPYIYAAWHWIEGVYDPRGPRLTASVLLAVAAVVLARDVARVHGRRSALWTAAIYVGASFALAPSDGVAANYAHFAMPLATMAMVASRRTGWRPLLGGALLGLAILSRQSWVLAVPAAVGSWWLADRARAIVAGTVGLTAGLALGAAMAPWDHFWFWTFESSPGYVFSHLDLRSAGLSALASITLFVALHLVLLEGAAASLPASLHTKWDLWAWTLTGCAAAVSGFRFFGHYWLQVVPPLAVLSGPAVAAWSSRRRIAATWVLATTAVFSVVAQCVPAMFRTIRDPEPVASVIRACTAPADRVFLWGSFPQLLVAADRPVAGTLLHSDFVTGRSGGRPAGTDAVTPGALEQMMSDLRADPPTVMIDTSGDPELGYSAFPMLGEPGLRDLAVDYRPQVVDRLVLWWRTGHGCGRPRDL